MAWFRNKQTRGLDAMGPGDVLLATAGTLKQQAARELIQRAVFDDELNLRAQSLVRGLGNTASLDLINICSDVLEKCAGAVRSGEIAREAVVHGYVSKLLLDCRRLLDVETKSQAKDPESLLILTTLRGTLRLLELGRRNQAAQVIGYGMSLALYLTSTNYKTTSDGQMSVPLGSHHASWKNNGCTIHLESGNPFWRFDREPDAHFDFLYAEAAAAQLQIAYKQPVSFPDSERKLLEVLMIPFQAAGESIPTGLSLDFDWDPPLPVN